MIGMWSCFHGIHGLEDLAEINVRGSIGEKGTLL